MKSIIINMLLSEQRARRVALGLALAVLLSVVAVGDAVVGDVAAEDAANADEAALRSRAVDVGMVLVSTDEAARRAVVRLDDGTLRVVEVGDAWLDGRGRVESIVSGKLVARFRFTDSKRTGDRDATKVTSGEWLRVWIHERRSGESRPRVQVVGQRGSSQPERRPIADEGVAQRVVQEAEGDDGGAGTSTTSQR